MLPPGLLHLLQRPGLEYLRVHGDLYVGECAGMERCSGPAPFLDPLEWEEVGQLLRGQGYVRCPQGVWGRWAYTWAEFLTPRGTQLLRHRWRSDGTATQEQFDLLRDHLHGGGSLLLCGRAGATRSMSLACGLLWELLDQRRVAMVSRRGFANVWLPVTELQSAAAEPRLQAGEFDLLLVEDQQARNQALRGLRSAALSGGAGLVQVSGEAEPELALRLSGMDGWAASSPLWVAHMTPQGLRLIS